MWVLGKLLQCIWLATTVLSVWAWSKGQFVENLVRDYVAVDQAGQADTNRDGLITSQEFQQSLYQVADSKGNNDNRVSLAEFVDAYASFFNVSSELAVIMFDILNDPNTQDDVITTRDVSLMSFLGRDYARIEEFRSGLEKWFRQAAERLYQHLTTPHVIGRNQNEGPRYEGIVNVDANRDGTVSLNELRDEIAKYHSSLSVSRTSWVKRNVEVFDADPVPSVLTFDLWDRNGDLTITPHDLPSTLQDMDLDGDDQVTTEELLRYTERGYKLSQKLLGLPIQHSLMACPVPWWSPQGLSPTIDSIRATMDLDADMDGWITLDDMDRWLAVFDANGDERLDVEEFTVQQSGRYGVNGSVAAAMFDMADTNGDGGLSAGDWIDHFQDGIEISFCDVRRSLLDLVRLGEVFQDTPQGAKRRNAMKKRLQDEWSWYLQNNMMMTRPFGRETNLNLCQGRRACYPGESTAAWGLAGASLWWGSEVDRKWNKEMTGPAGLGPTWSSLSTAPFLPFRRSTQTHNPFRRGNTPTGGFTGSLPFSSSQNRQGFGSSLRPQGTFSQKPVSKANNPSQGYANPLFKRYQHLFGPPRKNSAPAGQRTNEKPSQFGSTGEESINSNGEKETQRSTASFTGSQTPVSTGMKPPKPGLRPENSAERMGGDISRGKVGMGSGNLHQQFPFPARTSMPVIGLSTYPVVLGLDPWIFGGLPNWRWGGRKKRHRDLHEETDENSLQNFEENIDKRLSENTRVARDADLREDKNKQQKSSVVKEEENGNDTSDSFDPLKAPHLDSNSLAFGFPLSPYDMWVSWMMESLFWESLANQTKQDLNATELDSLWREVSQWLEKELGKSMNNLTHGQDETQDLQSPSRSKRATIEDNTMGNKKGYITHTRNRHIESQRFRRNPYFNAIRNWMRNYGQIFKYHNRDFGSYNPSSFGASGPLMNNDEWLRAPWLQSKFQYNGPMFMGNYLGNRYWSHFPFQSQYPSMDYGRMRNKRQTENISGDDEGDGNLEGHKKRALAFGKWLQTKGNGESRLGNEYNRKTHSPSSTNLWRGAVSQYGHENNWKEHQKSESGQWGSSAKEKYGYSDEKWLSGSDPYGRSHSWQSGYSSPKMRNDWWQNNMKSKLTTPSNGYSSFKAYPGRGFPKNFAAFFVGGSPSQNFHSDFGGMNGRPTGVGDSRPWFSPMQLFRSSNDRGQDNYNYPYSAFSLFPIYKTVDGNDFGGWSSRINPWTKRHIKDEDPHSKKNYAERVWKRTKRESIRLKDNQWMKSQSEESDVSRKLRDHWDAFGFNDFGMCQQDNTGNLWWSPWRSWNYINSKSARETHKKSKGYTNINNRHAFKDIQKAKRGFQCDRGNRNYLQSFNNELHRLRRFGQWLRQNGWDSFNTPTWGNPWSLQWRDSMMHRYPWWNNQLNGMRSPFMFSQFWYPWHNYGGWNTMRYHRSSEKEDIQLNEDQIKADRVRRDTEEHDRNKRWNNWWNQNSMLYRDPWLNSKWNEMRSPFKYSRFWYPWYNYGSMNSMRYPRTSQQENVKLETDLTKEDRVERVAAEVARNKRSNQNWSNRNSMMNRYPWWNNQWNRMQSPFMSSQFWHPWYNYRNMNMRYPRTSEPGDIQINEDETNEKLEKRDAEVQDRNKRWNNWWNQNSMIYRYPWWNSQWNGMRSPFMYSQFWYPWYNYGNMNSMRYPRTLEQEDVQPNEDQTNRDREKRDIEEQERNKRWNTWWNQNSMMYRYPWWNSQWNGMRSPFMRSQFWYPGYNYGNMNMRYPRTSKAGDIQINADETNENREKRDTQKRDRKKRWNNWWSQNSMMYRYPWWNSQWNGSPFMYFQFWYPGYNYGNMNSMRYPRALEQEDAQLNEDQTNRDRKKRDAEVQDRNKRWNNWWNQNSMMYRYPWWNSQLDGMRGPFMYSQFWFPGYNYGNMNSMRYPRTSEQKEGQINEDQTNENRVKRDAVEADRNKRWNKWWNQNSMMYKYPSWNSQWNGMRSPFMYSQFWYPWYNYGNMNSMRYPRTLEQEDVQPNEDQTNRDREKRDIEEQERNKRWNTWWNQNSMMYRYPWWNSQWNGMRSPFMYSQFWYPGYNYGNMNSMRYPRTSEQKEDQINENQTNENREKRDTEEVDRNKRWNTWWNHDSMMYRYPWGNNQWNKMQNSFMSSQFWHPWYNYRNIDMRYPRTSKAEDIQINEDETNENRVKRDAEEQDRNKRWNNWWNQNSMMHRYPWWNSQWNGMRSPFMYFQFWYPRYNYGNMNSMRYPRTLEQKEGQINEDQTNENRVKRDAVEADRNKRWNKWWNQNSMMYRYPWWNSQWNGMRSPFMYSQFWYPWYNYGNMDSMRYPRTLEQEDVQPNEDQTNENREKRDTEEVDRNKRWNTWWNHDSMMYRYPWWNNQWNRMQSPFMSSQFWHPWYNYRNMNMRYPRTSEAGGIQINEDETNEKLEKRDAEVQDRNKRWNNWWNQNSLMNKYPWWNSQWNGSPFMYSQFWYPGYNYGNMNYMRYSRTSEQKEGQINEDQTNESRVKRDAVKADRAKRWNNWWNQNSMMYRYPWWNSQWNGMRSPFMYSQFWYPGYNYGNMNSMRYPRTSEQNEGQINEDQTNENREKRDTEEHDRNKRWNNWWNQNSMMHRYPWWNSQWNGMRSPFMYSQFLYPGYNYGNMNSMRYPRTLEQEDVQINEGQTNTDREKRDTEEQERNKRWNTWWNHDSMMYRYPWWNNQWNRMQSPFMSSQFYHPWYNYRNMNMRYPRNSEPGDIQINEDETNESRERRDAEVQDRNKRWSNWWNQYSMVDRYPWWNSQWNGMRSPFMYSQFGYPWYNYGNMNSMRYPRTLEQEDTQLKVDQTNAARAKRDTEEVDRTKRWNNWWNQNSMMYRYPWWNNQWNRMSSPFMYSQFWYPWYNYGNMNSMRYPRTLEQEDVPHNEDETNTEREKRDAEEPDRNKRWNKWWSQNSMMYRYPLWSNQWNRLGSPFMHSQFWYPWYNYGNMNSMRYPRTLEQADVPHNEDETNTDREKRDAEEPDRNKRWNNWWSHSSMMYRHPWWNSQWNGMRSQFMHSQFWHPWYNYGNMNSMRYPRTSEQEDIQVKVDQTNADRAKRDTEEVDRTKRWNNWWNQNSMMNRHPWWNSQWNGIRSQFMHSQFWHPWYNYGNMNSMRYPRTSEQEGVQVKVDQTNADRAKRDTEEVDRTKRWNNWWNQNSMMNRHPWWNSQWNGMRSQFMHSQFWHPWYNYGNMNSMRYPRTSEQEDVEVKVDQTNADRAKRDTEEVGRTKRWNNWWNQNSMMNRHPWWNSQWNVMRSPFMFSPSWYPWYNYGNMKSMRYPRTSEQDDDQLKDDPTQADRTKRDTTEMDRNKRWNNWWNRNSMMYRFPSWNSQWNRMTSPFMYSQFWYPWYNYGSMNSMRYPRTSEPESVQIKDDTTNGDRVRRDTEEVDRNKRWNNWWNRNSMMYTHPWWNSQWNGMTSPLMYSQVSYPWYNYGSMNSMRYPRTSKEEVVQLTNDPTQADRTKQDTAEVDRNKRWNNWWYENSMMYRYPRWNGHWNGMRSPFMYSQVGYPWHNYGNMNSMRYPRTSEQETVQVKDDPTNGDRVRRDTEGIDRNKRWNNWWNRNSLMYTYPWWNSQWNGMGSPFMYGNMNSMRYPRTSEQEGVQLILKEEQPNGDRVKRDTVAVDRKKRWPNWGNQNVRNYIHVYPWWNNHWSDWANGMTNSFMHSQSPRFSADDATSFIRYPRSTQEQGKNFVREQAQPAQRQGPVDESHGSAKSKRKYENTRPIVSSLKSLLSGREKISKHHRTASNVRSQYTGPNDDVRHVKRTWETMRMRNQLTDGFHRFWSKYRGTNNRKSPGNNWFMGWMSRNSFGPWANINLCNGERNAWSSFCPQAFFPNAFRNGRFEWMSNNLDGRSHNNNNNNNNNNNVASSWWFPPLNTGFTWYPPFPFYSNFGLPWLNYFGGDFNGGGRNNYRWGTTTNGWSTFRWPRALDSKPKDKNDA